MSAWLRRHRKELTIGLMLTLAGGAYAGVNWLTQVNRTICDIVPEHSQLLNEHERSIIRLETENDGFRERIAENREANALMLEKLNNIDVVVRALYWHVTGEQAPE